MSGAKPASSERHLFDGVNYALKQGIGEGVDLNHQVKPGVWAEFAGRLLSSPEYGLRRLLPDHQEPALLADLYRQVWNGKSPRRDKFREIEMWAWRQQTKQPCDCLQYALRGMRSLATAAFDPGRGPGVDAVNYVVDANIEHEHPRVGIVTAGLLQKREDAKKRFLGLMRADLELLIRRPKIGEMDF